MPLSWAAARASAIWKATSRARRTGERTSGERGAEALALEELLDEEVSAGDLLERVDRSDVRVVDRGEQPRLTLEPRALLRCREELLGKDLDRHVPAQARVVGAVDLAHPAGAERREDLIGTECRPGGNHQKLIQAVRTNRLGRTHELAMPKVGFGWLVPCGPRVEGGVPST